MSIKQRRVEASGIFFFKYILTTRIREGPSLDQVLANYSSQTGSGLPPVFLQPKPENGFYITKLLGKNLNNISWYMKFRFKDP